MDVRTCRMTKRSDAQKNRSHILSAATAVFAEQGALAPLELICERAGVGRATLYRNFSDREALHRALLNQMISDLEAWAKTLPKDETDFELLLQRARQGLLDYAALFEFWSTLASPPHQVEAMRARLVGVFAGPLERTRAAGLVSQDVAADDILPVLRMLGAAIKSAAPHDRQASGHRALLILIQGLRGFTLTPQISS
ncbi:transcriptional regulator, TetR family [Thalassovita taeanensis]|uniref:Transcriptional regulator, TetR family n=2 Tax=Thalassovita taeanensis TaxID=657014 RepID=A0A1H9DGC5_9RHOB|nr:transcriptional regulator, TetR family [Thalassovita taeanensis]